MLKRIVIAILAVLAILTAGSAALWWTGERALQRERQAWLDLGGVLDPDDFAPPPIPDDRNAAVAYEPIFDFLRGLSDKQRELLRVDPTASPAAAALLEECARLIPKIREATKIDTCRWEVDYTRVHEAPTPSVVSARLALKLLCMHARQAAARDDGETVVRDLEAATRLARHSSTDHTLGGQLLAVSMFSLLVDTYHEIFSDRAVPPNEIGSMLTQFEHRDPPTLS